MNILFITHYSELYGANRSLLLLLEGLKEKKINLMVFVPKDGQLLNELDRLNIRYKKIKFWSWMGVRDNFFYLKASLRILLNLLVLPILFVNAMKFKPSLIYTNSSTTPIGIYLSLLLKKPHVWHVRELGKLDYNVEYDFGRKYFNYFMRKSEAIICISNFVKENLFKGDWKNVSIISNAVYSNNDLEKVAAKPNSEKDKAFTFLIMSVVHPSKGIQDAIEALERIKREFAAVKLIICGGDEDKKYRRKLDDLVTQLELNENVFFKGFVDKPNEMYEIADAVLVCSRNEAWGRVAAEAMIFEKPVIGFNGGGTREIITNNFNGFLYDNIEELVSCMKTVIFDKDQVKKMTFNAKQSALQRFSSKEYTENIFRVITNLVK